MDFFNHPASQPLPKLVRRVVLLLLFSCASSRTSQGQDEAALVIHQAGELPIVISAPHGGNREVPGSHPRTGEGQVAAPGKFVTARDGGTEELAQLVSKAVEARFGKKPYLVASRAHRRYVDPNRPADAAFEDAAAERVYRQYHDTLEGYCRTVRREFGRGLLLDLHGQGSKANTVFRGTQNGKTVALLRERFGEPAHSGPESLTGLLKVRGWTMHPDPFDGREQGGFTGGYIVQTYSSEPFGLDAIQLEFGNDYRKPDAREQTARDLAEAAFHFAGRYLDLAANEAQGDKANRLNVGVFRGEGTGPSRSTLLTALAREPRLKVFDLTVEEIRKGDWNGARVLIHPGGSGGGQGRALGEEGREQIRRFVADGGGYVGVCAGAYLATCDYDWSLKILDAKVLDREHWARGFGDVELSVTPAARTRLGLDRDQVTIYYHQGPLLAPADDPAVPDYEGLASFTSEITKNGAPPGIMLGATAIAAGEYHKGRVLCFSPHPEKTAGLEPLLTRAVLWTAETPAGGR